MPTGVPLLYLYMLLNNVHITVCIHSSCPCGHQFSIEHDLSCPMGGFPAIPVIRHNEVRDITASLLTEVWPDVSIQSHLQPLTEELLQYCTANVKDNARLDIAFVGRMVRESIF